MHGWAAYSHGVGDEAMFRGELTSVVTSAQSLTSPKRMCKVHAYVSISNISTVMVLRA